MGRVPAFSKDGEDKDNKELSGRTPEYNTIIEECERAKAALRKSEEDLEKIQEMAHIGRWEWDISGKKGAWSDELYRIYGVSKEFDPTYNAFIDRIHPDDRAYVEASMRAALYENKPYEIDFRIIRRDGEVRIIHTDSKVIRNEAGEPVRMFGTGQDVTYRKNTEMALRESEEKFRILTETSSAAIFFHQGGRFIYANPAAETMTGFSQDELLSMDFWKIMAPEYREMVKSRGLARLSGDNSIPRYDIKILTKDGREKWLELSSARMEYKGRPAIMATALDITQRKHAEEALRLSEGMLRSYYELPLIGMALTSPDKGWIQANEKLCQILGYTREELMQTTWDKITHPEDLDRDVEYFDMLIAGKIDSYTIEKRFIHKSGKTVSTEISIGCIRNPDKSIRYIAGLMQDITKRKQAEGELKVAKAQAELYLDLMGHDINNMHQIAMGYLELAGNMSPDPAMQELLDKPIEVLQRSARLITNVRKLQKLNDGSFRAGVVDVCAVLADVIKEYRATSGKAMTLDLYGNEHCHVRANELLHDVFSNLVSNAIKHTGDNAGISIRLKVEKDGANGHCFVSVEDSGPGIQDEKKRNIFNRMLKGTSKTKGIGIGLYLVRSLVDSYNGKVWVEDRVPGDYSKGSRFVVMLPIARQ